MKTVKFILATGCLFAVSVFATTNSCENMIKGIPGTYKLIKRVLPNGTVLSGSTVQGTTIFGTDGYRVTTVIIKEGSTNFAAALQSKYSFTSSKFSDQQESLVLHDGSGPLIIQFDQARKSAPITCTSDTLTISNPPDDPLSSLSFTKNTMKAILNKGIDSGAIDYWKKMS